MRHVLPNIMPVVIIIFSITVGGVILSLASLSFLGFGLPPGVPDWGGMLSYEGRRFMEQAPWLALWPGLALTITIYCLNMFGDAHAGPPRPQAQGQRSVESPPLFRLRRIPQRGKDSPFSPWGKCLPRAQPKG